MCYAMLGNYDGAIVSAATRPDNTAAVIACTGEIIKQLVSYRPTLNHCFSSEDAENTTGFSPGSLISVRPLNLELQLYMSRGQKIGGFYDDREHAKSTT